MTSSTDPFFLSAATAEPHVGSAFTLWAGSEQVTLMLDAVERVGGSDDCFALVFRTSAVLPQATYPVEHEVLGRTALFLVPVGRDADGALYEAVFNRTPVPA